MSKTTCPIHNGLFDCDCDNNTPAPTADEVREAVERLRGETLAAGREGVETMVTDAGRVRTLLRSHAAQAQRIGKLEMACKELSKQADRLMGQRNDETARAERAEAELAKIKSSPKPLWPDDDPMICAMAQERDALKAKVEALEWLVEVQTTLDAMAFGNWWSLRVSDAITELQATLRAALRGAEGE